MNGGIFLVDLLIDFEAWSGTGVPPSRSSGQHVDTLSARAHVRHTQVKKLITNSPAPLIMGRLQGHWWGGTTRQWGGRDARGFRAAPRLTWPSDSHCQGRNSVTRLGTHPAWSSTGSNDGLELDWLKRPPRHDDALRKANRDRFLADGGQIPSHVSIT